MLNAVMHSVIVLDIVMPCVIFGVIMLTVVTLSTFTLCVIMLRCHYDECSIVLLR